MAFCNGLYIKRVPQLTSKDELLATIKRKYYRAFRGGISTENILQYPPDNAGFYSAIIRGITADFRMIMLIGTNITINGVKSSIHLVLRYSVTTKSSDTGDPRNEKGELIKSERFLIRERDFQQVGITNHVINIFNKEFYKAIFPAYLSLQSNKVVIQNVGALSREESLKLEVISFAGHVDARRPAGPGQTSLEYRSVIDAAQAIRVLNLKSFKNVTNKTTIFQVVSKNGVALETKFEGPLGFGPDGKILKQLYDVQGRYGYIPLPVFGSHCVETELISQREAKCWKCKKLYSVVGVDYFLHYLAGKCDCQYVDLPTAEAYSLYDELDGKVKCPPMGDPQNMQTAYRWEGELFTRLVIITCSNLTNNTATIMHTPLTGKYVNAARYRQILLPIIQQEHFELCDHFNEQMARGRVQLVVELERSCGVEEDAPPSAVCAANLKIDANAFWIQNKFNIRSVKLKLYKEKEGGKQYISSSVSRLFGVVQCEDGSYNLLLRLSVFDSDISEELWAKCFPLSNSPYNKIVNILTSWRKGLIQIPMLDAIILGVEPPNCYLRVNFGKAEPFESFLKCAGTIPFSLKHFNENQKKALYNAIKSKASIVIGPPGAEKTITAALIVGGIWSIEKKAIIASASTNHAAENLAVSINNFAANHNVRVKCLRLLSHCQTLSAPPTTDESRGFDDLHTKIKNHPNLFENPEFQPYENQLLTEEHHLVPDTVLDAFYDHVKALQIEIMRQYDVFICTVSSLMDKKLENLIGTGFEVSTILIDEAAQLPQYHLIPALKLGVERIVLVGDPSQLCAMTNSISAENAGVTISAMEVLIRRKSPIPTVMLTVQYRMHPEISLVVSEFQYGGLLQNGANVHLPNPLLDKILYNVLRIRNSKRVIVCNHRHPQEQVGNSYRNIREAFDAANLAHKLLANGLAASDLGIITMYDLQRHTVTLELLKMNLSGIKVSNVDTYQGQEMKVVILCLTRGGASASQKASSTSIGFLNEPNRLNVGLSRAKELLFIMANLGHLRSCHNPFIQRLVSLLDKYSDRLDNFG